jgi:hypothetical protein
MVWSGMDASKVPVVDVALGGGPQDGRVAGPAALYVVCGQWTA